MLGGVHSGPSASAGEGDAGTHPAAGADGGGAADPGGHATHPRSAGNDNS